MKKLIVATMLLGLTNISFAADIAAGKAASTICATCHGATGTALVPIYPNLKGQNEAYLLSSLKAYKLGERKGGMSAVMAPQAAVLSDEDMANLAAYYASQE